MLKILFLSHYFYPRLGGVEKHVLNLCRTLTSRGYHITVITSHYSPELKHTEDLDGIRVIRIPLRSSWNRPHKFELWQQLFRLRHEIGMHDIIHCHDVFFWYLPFRFLFPFKPVFTTFHGYEGVFPPSSSSKRLRKISEKLSRGNICVGEFIEKWYGTRSTYITYGATQSYPLTPVPQTNTLLFLGRLDKDTGIEIFLSSLQQLGLPQTRQFKVEFCGDGSYRDHAEIYGSVHGFQSDISPFINRNRYIFTSGYLSMLEVMAHQRLIFSNYNNELKKDYLYLSPFKDRVNIYQSSSELSKQLKSLSESSYPKARIIDNYHWAMQQTWEQLADVYVKLWHNPK